MKWVVFGVSLLILAGPATARADLPPLVLVRAHGGARFELPPATDGGGFDEDALGTAREAFAYYVTGFSHSHDVHPRVLDLAYRAMRHFDKDHVEIVSGYRRTRASSRHAHGRAMDFRIPGVTIDELATFLRAQGFVGVGIYPRSGFVHCDVRGASYFWVDYSGPGRHGREHEILGNLAHEMDAAAVARGESPDPDVIAAEHVEQRGRHRRHPQHVSSRPTRRAHARHARRPGSLTWVVSSRYR